MKAAMDYDECIRFVNQNSNEGFEDDIIGFIQVLWELKIIIVIN